MYMVTSMNFNLGVTKNLLGDKIQLHISTIDNETKVFKFSCPGKSVFIKYFSLINLFFCFHLYDYIISKIKFKKKI